MSIAKNWIRQAGVELTRIAPWTLIDIDHAPKSVKENAFREAGNRDSWEYSYHIRRDWLDQIVEREEERIEKESAPLLSKFGDVIYEVSTDPYCIEIKSSILEQHKSLARFFHAVDKFGEEQKLLRFSDVVGGTGGHIHLSCDSAAEAGHLKRIMLLHPEALFAFAHPGDDQHSFDHIPAENVSKPAYRAPWSSHTMLNVNVYNTDEAEDIKGPVLSYRAYHGTVEFRLFDVAQTWEMQEEHMAFAQAFMAYGLKTGRPAKLPTREDLFAITQDQHITNFEKLIRTLGLPWKRYRHYVENMQTRFEWETPINFDP